MQPDPKKGKPHTLSEEANLQKPGKEEPDLRKTIADWFSLDKLKAPVVNKLTDGYMSRGGKPAMPTIQEEELDRTGTPYPASNEPTRQEVYSAIYAAFNFGAMKEGQRAKRLARRTPNPRAKNRTDERAIDLLEFAGEQVRERKKDNTSRIGSSRAPSSG